MASSFNIPFSNRCSGAHTHAKATLLVMMNSKHSHRKLSFVAFNAILSLCANKQIYH